MDIPQLGSSVVVVSDDDATLAAARCTDLAQEVWHCRREYLTELTPIEDAVRQAHASSGLVVLSDSADATTSGAPGDSVWILKELVKYEWPRPALVTVVSPEVVDLADQAGAGARLDIELGGIRDTRFGTSIGLTCLVERVFSAEFTMTGHIGKNMRINMGKSVVLRSGNVHVFVTSRTGPHFAPELFRTAGMNPFAASVLVAKSPCGFRAVYQDRAELIFSVKTPGCAPPDFWNYPFENIPRPIWPWDEMESWRPDPTVVASNLNIA